MGLPETRWKQRRVMKEHIRLVGPAEDKQAALDWLHDRDFEITRSGPYTDDVLFPRVDMTRFLFTAQRIVHDSK